jgi:3-phenylpropionate/cinnamic acid dioxygenase small subunit
MLIEWQCTSVIHRTAYFQDIEDFDSLAQQYTEDAEYHSNVSPLHGREQIRTRYGKVPGLTTRHVITNILFLDVQKDSAYAVSYEIDYFTTGEEGENPFVNAMMFELHDRFRFTDEGWLICSRTPKMVFLPNGGFEKLAALLAQVKNTS